MIKSFGQNLPELQLLLSSSHCLMEVGDGAELCFPQLLNTSCRKPTLPWSEVVFLHTLLSSISPLTVALNLLVIISVSHFRQTSISQQSLHLSFSTIPLLPGEILRKTSCWFPGDLVCSLYKYLGCIITSVSVGDMVLISADRYVAICDPLHYPTRITVTRVKLCVCLCWLFSVLYSNLYLKDGLTQPDRYISCYGECVINTDYVAGAVDLVVTSIAPITVIIVLYMRIFTVAVSQARAMRSHITAVRLQRSVTPKAKKSELKAARTLGVLVFVFLICFCPYYCVSFAGDNVLSASSIAYVIYLPYFNSCLNPVIYALFYPWFKKAITQIVTFKILQPGSSEANIL
ncbi:trace amine-associated receptor 13c-like [Siniperca chuatsi]|uniref:trace amine-associated receptor 13c-like n=1 Tax=Siniperca chuatsi TaxID=119488 RepID=UPI001CE10F47|nr:trace amine-associated receptor 13c-like [Siniperca chuatsi]